MSSRRSFVWRPRLPAGGFADGTESLASQAVTASHLCSPRSQQQKAELLLPHPVFY